MAKHLLTTMSDRVSTAYTRLMSPQSHGHRGGRGGSAGRGGGHGNTAQEKPKKEAILNLAKYVDQQIRVKFMGGREGTCAHLTHCSDWYIEGV